MTAVDVAAPAMRNLLLGALGRFKKSRYFQPVAVAAVMFIALVLLPGFGGYWVRNFTTMAYLAVLAASAGMLYGRVGLVSLGQVAPFGIGTWVTMRLAFATSLPYPILMLIGAVAATILGVLIAASSALSPAASCPAPQGQPPQTAAPPCPHHQARAERDHSNP